MLPGPDSCLTNVSALANLTNFEISMKFPFQNWQKVREEKKPYSKPPYFAFVVAYKNAFEFIKQRKENHDCLQFFNSEK